VRQSISSFHAIGNTSAALARLESDIVSGEWARRYEHLLDLTELDCGYRLVVTEPL
jgi:hypothetical protein